MSDPVIRLNEALGAPKVLVTRGTVTSAAAGPGTSSSSASWFRHWRSQLSLLTLILAACSGSDCVSGPLCGDGGGDPPPPVTGTISGTVTVGETGISSVTVTLSNGSATTTGASGNYSFSGVPVGSYTVTISNVSSEVTCGTTSLSVTISSSALQATAHFTCVPAANASISGTVTAEGFSVPNVEVVLSGPSPATAMTDANGQFSFTSLLAGAYTVMISGFSEALYLFTTTSQSVTLAAGQSATVNFEGLTCLVGSISMNQTVDGTLASGNCSLTSGEFVDVWSFSLGSSTAVQINLTSSEFDTFLILTDDMIVTLAEDDDSGPGLNSQINITLEAGDYLIWATSFDPGESGSYQLSLNPTVVIAAEVTISSITVSGTGETVDRTAVVGAIDVNLTIDEGTEEAETNRFVLVTNFFEELKQRVPN